MESCCLNVLLSPRNIHFSFFKKEELEDVSVLGGLTSLARRHIAQACGAGVVTSLPQLHICFSIARTQQAFTRVCCVAGAGMSEDACPG